MKRFAMLGAAGFVAPRHMRAIHDTGNVLVALADPYDGVGVIDRFFPAARFFTEFERFDRHLEKLRQRGEAVDFLSICSPNYLHDAHCRLAMRVGAHAICEKPLVISPWNLDQLAQIERDAPGRIYTVLQLRLHDAVGALRREFAQRDRRERVEAQLTYITRRGSWYHHSWKGSLERSGGLAMNIGIHFFDLLLWLFGGVQRCEVHLREKDRMAGLLELEWARVRWFLSVNGEDLPESCRAQGEHAYRALSLGDRAFDFSTGFDGLHTRVYKEILAGRGWGIEDARPSIDLVHRIRTEALATPDPELSHPLLVG